MKKSKKILIGFLISITSLIILPFFISMRTYLNEAERVASEKVGVPVTIASGHLRLLPSPRLVMKDISLGEHVELKVEDVVVIPTLSSLFSSTKVIDLEISKPVIKKAALDFISTLSGNDAKLERDVVSVNVRHVRVDELQLDWPDLKLPMLNIEANLTDANALDNAKVETIDGEVVAHVTPESGGHLISLKAKKWTPPVEMSLLIEHADVEMHLKENRLDISNLAIGLYGGEIKGNAAVSWVKGWQASGKLSVTNVSVKEPGRLMSSKVYMSGNLSGDGHFSSRAKNAGELADHLRADFKFNVNKGVLHGLDLVKIASLLLKKDKNGGETEFDEFSGLLNIEGKQYHIKDIKISSGLLAANGQVQVKPNKELDGAIEVALKHSVSLVAIPLDISGTVSDPVVSPSKAALAGAIAGTAILGPGVGTSLGVKAGGAIDKFKGLFQSK